MSLGITNVYLGIITDSVLFHSHVDTYVDHRSKKKQKSLDPTVNSEPTLFLSLGKPQFCDEEI